MWWLSVSGGDRIFTDVRLSYCLTAINSIFVRGKKWMTAYSYALIICLSGI